MAAPDAARSASDSHHSVRPCERGIRASRHRTRAPRPDLARTDRRLRHLGSFGALRWFGPIYTAGLLAPLLRNCDREIGPVRRADHACRHAAELVRRGPCTLPDGAGALAG